MSRPRHVAAVAALVCGACAAEEAAFPGGDLLRSGTQQVLVVVESPADTTGWLYRFARANGEWSTAGAPIPVTVGAAGVNKEREGDRRAPTGAFALTSVFGYDEQPPPDLHMPYLALRPETECVDDADSRFYNQIVSPGDGNRPWSSSEMMRRDLHNQDDLYKLGVLVAYNPGGSRDPASGKGAGSCIFLHIWRGPARPTVGCTAMPEAGLRELAAWLDPQFHPVLVQGPREALERLAASGKLPYSIPPRRL